MAMIDTARPAPFGAITTYQATNTLTGLYSAVTTWISKRGEARRTAETLSRLSPAMLSDIGYSQADVQNLRARAGML